MPSKLLPWKKLLLLVSISAYDDGKNKKGGDYIKVNRSKARAFLRKNMNPEFSKPPKSFKKTRKK